MAVSQLQHLETLFVKTGWLLAQGEAVNKKDAQAMVNYTKLKQSRNLYILLGRVRGDSDVEALDLQIPWKGQAANKRRGM